MNTNKPTTTKKYPIEVPTDQYYCTPCVYKVWFGEKKYLIWKGKSLLQSAELMSEQIERALRLGNDDDTHVFYKAWVYIRKARIMRATIQRMNDDFNDDWLELLKAEQGYLDQAFNDENCLNNNFKAYAPKWMGLGVIAEFNKWYDASRKLMKKPKKKNAASKNNSNRSVAVNKRKVNARR